MPSMTCPYCGHLTHATTKWTETIEIAPRTYAYQGAADCDNCHHASVAFRRVVSGENPGSHSAAFDVPGMSDSIKWQPQAAVYPDFPDVPEKIARAAQEAHAAHGINAQMAPLLMARAVIEATAKAHGITDGNLYTKIDRLKDADLIRKSTAEAAHEIRHLGNEMAHGDFDDLPEATDVREALELMDEVLNEVFQGPAKTERIKANRSK